MRILTKTQYDAICDIVKDNTKKLEEADKKMVRLWKTIDYLNAIFKARDKEILRLRRILDEHHISYKRNNIDFPATSKIEPENKIY